MATTVGQHSVAAFTSPVNGTTPIDANTVRGNDNTVRVAYVDHDADPGIHVQSSTLASRPVAGTAGRKWITEDSGVYTLWFDDGTNWHPVSSESVALAVLAGETLAKGDVVKVTGWNNGQDLPEVVKVSSASDVAFAVMTAAAANGTMGYATNTGIVQDVNTGSFSVGNILYPNTSGGFTATKPTSGNYQTVAFVLRSNTNNGVIYVEFSAPRIVERSDNTASTIVLRDASGNFSGGTITATTLTGTLSTAAQPNVTSVGTLTSLAVSGDLTVDTSTLKVDSTNNRVGIGTASPSYKLDVDAGAINTIAQQWRGAGTNFTLRVKGNDASSASTSAYRLYLDFLDGTNTNGFIDFYRGGAGNDGFLAFGTSGTEKMRLDASGHLLVGAIANPGILNKSVVIDSGSSSLAGYVLQNDTTGRTSTDGSALYINGSTLSLFNLENAAMVFGTNNAERARITSGGYFKASDDGTYVGATGAYHELRSSEATSACVYVQSTNASFTDGVVVLRASRAAGTAFNLITAQSNLVDQFSVRGDGTIFAQNTTVQSISDARLKENVVDATDGLNIITALRPVRYDWKAGYGNDRVNQLGFIAQEVEAVFPEAVSETTLDEETYKTVGPGALIPVLVKAIQELEARIAVLEAGA